MNGPGEPDRGTPSRCRSCPEGSMGEWAALRAGSSLVRTGELVVTARACDRCGSVELRARRITPDTAHPDPWSRRTRSARGELLEGLGANLRNAAEEVLRLVRAGRSSPGGRSG
jgi:hypothetical protein